MRLLFFLLLTHCFNSVFCQTKLTTLGTVCIDAGHGGKDPGCHGGVANEKTVCLSMALKLGARIKESYPKVKVIYTRDSDVFVELDERAKIANRNKADIFICIHANAGSTSAFGSETYVLGLHRTESQQNIADRENSTIYLEEDKGVKYNSFDLSPDAIIARQLQLSVFLDHSINFATKIQTEFKKIGRYDRGVKQAGFLVLYKTTMPSVLIETGFLSNLKDETYLKEDASQMQMANAMFLAFKKYKEELEGIDEKKNNINKRSVQTVDSGINKLETTLVDSSYKDKIIFKVQLESSLKQLIKDKKFENIVVDEIKEGNSFKYLTGSFENDFNLANKLKNEMRLKGFPNSFVIAFKNNIRIHIDEAIRLTKTR